MFLAIPYWSHLKSLKIAPCISSSAISFQTRRTTAAGSHACMVHLSDFRPIWKITLDETLWVKTQEPQTNWINSEKSNRNFENAYPQWELVIDSQDPHRRQARRRNYHTLVCNCLLEHQNVYFIKNFHLKINVENGTFDSKAYLQKKQSAHGHHMQMHIRYELPCAWIRQNEN